MKKRNIIWLITCSLLILSVIGGGTAYWIQRDQEPEFVRYHGQQPELTVKLLPGSDRKDQVPRVIQAAKKFWTPPSDYWPKPVAVVERDTYWWVKFAKKKKVMISNGQEEIRGYVPGNACIRVEKSNLTCSLVPTL